MGLDNYIKQSGSSGITVGSRAFFGCYKDFHSHDFDYLKLVENQTTFKYRYEERLRGIDTFIYKKEPAAKMIQRTLKANDPIILGKFLVPEVAKEIGATVEDILPLESLLTKLDLKHQYLAVIFEAIKNNGCFELTEEQRLKAYKVYKAARPQIYPGESE